ncbi:MAG: ECF-type sigma factor [Acidobacteriota bacterium]
MRLALIDHARSAAASKRGNGTQPFPLLEEVPGVVLGCSVEETAEILNVSCSTVDRKVRLARAWLFSRLHDSQRLLLSI